MGRNKENDQKKMTDDSLEKNLPSFEKFEMKGQNYFFREVRGQGKRFLSEAAQSV